MKRLTKQSWNSIFAFLSLPKDRGFSEGFSFIHSSLCPQLLAHAWHISVLDWTLALVPHFRYNYIHPVGGKVETVLVTPTHSNLVLLRVFDGPLEHSEAKWHMKWFSIGFLWPFSKWDCSLTASVFLNESPPKTTTVTNVQFWKSKWKSWPFFGKIINQSFWWL